MRVRRAHRGPPIFAVGPSSFGGDANRVSLLPGVRTRGESQRLSLSRPGPLFVAPFLSKAQPSQGTQSPLGVNRWDQTYQYSPS